MSKKLFQQTIPESGKIPLSGKGKKLQKKKKK